MSSNYFPIVRDSTVVSKTIINSGANLTVNSGASFEVSGISLINGDLNIQNSGMFLSNGLFDASGGSLNSSGNLYLSDSVKSLGANPQTNGMIVFNDTNNQSIPNHIYFNVTLDGGNKYLIGSTNIEGILSFGDTSNIITNNHSLILDQSPVGYSDNAHVIGELSINTYYVGDTCIFPIGPLGRLNIFKMWNLSQR